MHGYKRIENAPWHARSASQGRVCSSPLLVACGDLNGAHSSVFFLEIGECFKLVYLVERLPGAAASLRGEPKGKDKWCGSYRTQ